MRLVLEPEEAFALHGHSALRDLLRYEAAPVSEIPQRLPLGVLQHLLASAGRWMRPAASVRLDVENGLVPAIRPAVYRAETAGAEREWERRLLQAAHRRRLLAGQLTVAAAAHPGLVTDSVVVQVVTDDGHARQSMVVPAADELLVEEAAQILTENLIAHQRQAALAGD